MAKKLTLDDLKTRKERVEDKVLRIRTVLESHKIEREKIYSPENKRRLTVPALREDEQKLKTKTHTSLARWRGEIVDTLGDSFTFREQFSRDTMLRESRFFPAYSGSLATPEAKMNALMHELLEDVRRNGAERRAARYTPEDLALEAERAATQGDIATVAVLQQEAQNRTLSSEEKLAVDLALKRLELPDIDAAQQTYTDLEALVDEADSLTELWVNPKNEMAASRESLHRFNRRKRAEKLVHDTIAEGEEKAKMEARAKQHAAFPMPTDDPIEPQQSSAA